MVNMMSNTNRRPRFATAEKIGRHATPGANRYAKRSLVKARRANERRAIAAGAFDALPTNRRAYLRGWND